MNPPTISLRLRRTDRSLGRFLFIGSLLLVPLTAGTLAGVSRLAPGAEAAAASGIVMASATSETGIAPIADTDDGCGSAESCLVMSPSPAKTPTAR